MVNNKYEIFNASVLKGLIEGGLVGSNSGVESVVVLLEILRAGGGIFYAPGYMTSHSTMLEALGGKVNNVGWAGRASFIDFRNQVMLRSGGMSIPGYQLNRSVEMEEAMKKMLKQAGKPKIQVVWSS